MKGIFLVWLSLSLASQAQTKPAGLEQTRPVGLEQIQPVSPEQARPLDLEQLPSLSLEQVRQLALQNSPILASARARLGEARYQVDEAYSQASPRLKFTAGGLRTSPPVIPFLGGNPVTITPEYSTSAGLSLRQSLWDFGRLQWSAAVAERGEEARQTEFEQKADEVVEEVTLSFWDALLHQQQVVASQEQVKAREEHLAEVSQRVIAGTAAPFEVKRDRAALAQVQQFHLDNQMAARVARLRLFSLIQLPDQGQSLESPVRLPPPPESDVSAALLRRPDLNARRQSLEAARARVQQVQAQSKPNLVFQSDYVLRTPTTFQPGQQWTVGLQLEIPLLDGGLNAAQVGQEQKRVEQMEALYEQAERQARLEIEQLLLELQSRWKRLEVTQSGLESAQEATRIARLRYRNGLGTNVERLDSEAALALAQQDQLGAHYQYLQSWARYVRATAVDATPKEGTP